MKEFDGTIIVERNDSELISVRLGDDIVLMNTNNGNYIGMNAIGCDIWQLLTAPLSLDEIVCQIVNMYEVDEQYGKDKVQHFLQRMLECKVILESNNNYLPAQ